MPLGVQPICTVCKTTTSTIWKKGKHGEVLCNSCSAKQQSNVNGEKNENNNHPGSWKRSGNGRNNDLSIGVALRKSSRIKPSKHKSGFITKSIAPKGKSRRFIFKKNPIKAPTAVATVSTSDYIFHDGMYYQKGDIVSLMDYDGSVYYAQVRGFMKDQYNEMSAVITWLVPTDTSPRDRFDPATFILGPEEDLPRKMEFMEFVCHAPSDYFYSRNSPYPTIPVKPDLCYIWTNIGHEIRPVPTTNEIFGLEEIRDKHIASTSGLGRKDLEKVSRKSE